MAEATKPVAFTPEGARRIVRATQIVERSDRLPAIERSRFNGVPVGVVPAKTAPGGISAKSGSTAGSGNVTLYDMSESGSLTAGSTTIKAWNLGPAVAGNIDVLVAFGLRGPWIVVEPCS